MLSPMVPTGKKTREPLTPEQEELFDANHALVADILVHVRPTLPRELESDELVTAGLLGMADAARRFRKDVGNTFAQFAYQYVRGAMIDRAREVLPLSPRRAGDVKARQKLEERRERGDIGTATFANLAAGLTGARPIHFVRGPAIDLIRDSAASPETAVRTGMATKRLQDAIQSLRTTEREIIDLIDVQGKSFEEVAKGKGWHRSSAKRLHDQVLGLLRAMLKKHRDE